MSRYKAKLNSFLASWPLSSVYMFLAYKLLSCFQIQSTFLVQKRASQANMATVSLLFQKETRSRSWKCYD